MINITRKILDYLLIPALPDRPGHSEIPNRLWPVVGLMMEIAMLDNPLYLPAAHLPISFVLIETANALKFGPEAQAELKGLIEQALAGLALLCREQREAKGQVAACITPRHYKREFPTYAFLLKCGARADRLPLRHVLDFDRLSPTFRKFAVEAMQGMNRIRHHSDPEAGTLGPNDPTIYDARLMLEAVLDLFPRENLQVRSLLDLAQDRSLAEKLFKKDYARVASSRSAELYRDEEEQENNLENHIQRRLRALHYLTGLKRKKLRRAWRPKLVDLINEADDDQNGVKTGPASADRVREGTVSGDAPDEDLPTYTPAPPGGTSGANTGGECTEHWRNQRVLFGRDLSVSCARDVLSIQDLATNFEHWFQIPWQTQPVARKLGVFRCLATLLTGLHPAVLKKLYVGDQKSGKRLLKKRGIYFDLDLQNIVSLLPVERTINVMLEPGEDGRPRGAVVSIWPQLLKTMWRDLAEEIKPETGKTWPPKNIKVDNVCLAPARPARLKQGFEFWSCLHFGLPPEAASLIAGRPVLMRKTSLSYLRTNYQGLQDEYLSVCNLFLQTIIEHTSNPAQVRSNLPLSTPVPPIDHHGRVGSWYCPETDLVKQILTQMRTRVLGLDAMPNEPLADYREAICMYAFEILRVVTGMRTMAEPPFTSASFFKDGKWLRLCEKGKDLWRIIPLHPVAAELIYLLEKVNRRFLAADIKERPHLHKLKTRESLFWISEEFVAQPLTHQRQMDTAGRHGIDYPDLPSNAYRHFNRSKQFEYGCSHRIADFSMGHLHRGPHPLNRFSLVSPDTLAQEYLLFVDRLLDELEIGPLAVGE